MPTPIIIDGGLREQTPPANRRGPHASVGAQRLKGSVGASGSDRGPAKLDQPLDDDETPLPAKSRSPSSPKAEVIDGTAFVFIPTVEHMKQIMSKGQQAGGSPRSDHGAKNRAGSVAAIHRPPTVVGAASSPTPQARPPGAPTHDEVLQSLTLVVKFLSQIPRFAPTEPLVAVNVLKALVEQRALVDTTIVEAMADVASLGHAMTQSANRRLELEALVARLRCDVDTASDIALAADGQMILLNNELKAMAEDKKRLAAEFEKSIHLITHDGPAAARQHAAEYRTAECARVERECDELRAQLAKRNLWLVERGALAEAASRSAAAETKLRADLAERDEKIAAQQEEVARQKALLAVQVEAHTTERLALSRELHALRSMRACPRQTEILSRSMLCVSHLFTRSQAWCAWQRFVSIRREERRADEVTAERLSVEELMEGKLLRFKEEKAILVRELGKRTQKVDEQMLQLQTLQAELREGKAREEKLRADLHAMRNAPLTTQRSPLVPAVLPDAVTVSVTPGGAMPSESPASVALPKFTASPGMSPASPWDGPPTSLIDIARKESVLTQRKKPPEDPQVHALKAYHMLHTVLLGIKRRLQLESLRIPAIPVAERSTEPVATIVFDWIQEVFEFLHHVMSIEDRLLRTKVRLTYLNVQLRPNIKRVEAQMRFSSSDPPRLRLLRKQLGGYMEIAQGVKAMKGHVDATLKALVSSTDPKKHEQIGMLTSTFEADVAAFLQRVEDNKKLQFKFEVELVRLREAKNELLQRLLQREPSSSANARPAARDALQGSGNSNRGDALENSRKRMLQHDEAPPDVSFSPAFASPSPSSLGDPAGNKFAAGTAAAQGKQALSATIGELLPTLRQFQNVGSRGSVGSWEQNNSRPMSTEELKLAAAEEALDHQGRRTSDDRGSETAPQVPGDAAENPREPEGGDADHKATDEEDAEENDGNRGRVTVPTAEDPPVPSVSGAHDAVTLRVVSTEDGIEVVAGGESAPPSGVTSKPTPTRMGVTLTRNIPGVGQFSDSTTRGGGGGQPRPKVLDTWAERKREGWRISSILEGDPKGGLSVKDYLRLLSEASAAQDGIRRSLAQVEALPKSTHARKKSRGESSTTSQQKQSSAAAAKSPTASSVAEKDEALRQLLRVRDNRVRPSVARIDDELFHVPLEESSDVLRTLLPRLGR